MKKLFENWNKFINENEQTKPSWLVELERYVEKAKEFLELGKPIDLLNWGALAIEIEEDDQWLAHKVKALSGQDTVVSSPEAPEALEKALLHVQQGLEKWNENSPTEEELNEISGKQKAHIARQKKQQEERAKKDAEAQELIQLIGKEWDVNVRMLEDRYQITVNKAFDSSYDEEEPSDEEELAQTFKNSFVDAYTPFIPTLEIDVQPDRNSEWGHDFIFDITIDGDTEQIKTDDLEDIKTYLRQKSRK